MHKSEATVEDLYRVRDKAEIVNGELVMMAAAGGLHGYAAGVIHASLFDYARSTKRGYALPDNVGFIVNLPNRRSFSPDVAFWTGAPLTAKFPEGAPIFAVEVRSEEDYGPAAERVMADKRADYFAAGTLVVWDVDVLDEHVVRVYRAANPADSRAYRRAEHAEAEPALAGWSMPVDDLFPPGKSLRGNSNAERLEQSTPTSGIARSMTLAAIGWSRPRFEPRNQRTPKLPAAHCRLPTELLCYTPAVFQVNLQKSASGDLG